MAWDKTIPANDALLTNFPANCRANWEALEALTNASLQITNAKVAAGAGIVDTKLATISTAGKVSGAALTLLPNVPSGAGVLPSANSPNKLKADASDTTPQYLDSLINTDMFEVSDGDLLELKDDGVETEKLESGSASPGNSKYYGTSSGGSKGFHTLVSNLNINGQDEKTDIHDDDLVLIEDSEDSNNPKKVKKSNLIESKVSLGSWSSKSVDTVYEASTDGFVVAWGEKDGATPYIRVKTDGSNPPTTITAYQREGEYANDSRQSVTSPVKSGDYWKTESGNLKNISVYWIPLS